VNLEKKLRKPREGRGKDRVVGKTGRWATFLWEWRWERSSHEAYGGGGRVLPGVRSTREGEADSVSADA